MVVRVLSLLLLFASALSSCQGNQSVCCDSSNSVVLAVCAHGGVCRSLNCTCSSGYVGKRCEELSVDTAVRLLTVAAAFLTLLVCGIPFTCCCVAYNFWRLISVERLSDRLLLDKKKKPTPWCYKYPVQVLTLILIAVAILVFLPFRLAFWIAQSSPADEQSALDMTMLVIPMIVSPLTTFVAFTLVVFQWAAIYHFSMRASRPFDKIKWVFVLANLLFLALIIVACVQILQDYSVPRLPVTVLLLGTTYILIGIGVWVYGGALACQMIMSAETRRIVLFSSTFGASLVCLGSFLIVLQVKWAPDNRETQFFYTSGCVLFMLVSLCLVSWSFTSVLSEKQRKLEKERERMHPDKKTLEHPVDASDSVVGSSSGMQDFDEGSGAGPVFPILNVAIGRDSDAPLSVSSPHSDSLDGGDRLESGSDEVLPRSVSNLSERPSGGDALSSASTFFHLPRSRSNFSFTPDFAAVDELREDG